MRSAVEQGWPSHGGDEYTAMTFQLNADPEHPMKHLFRFMVGDRAMSPLGPCVITWLDEATGNCLVMPTEKTTVMTVTGKKESGCVWVNGDPLELAPSLKIRNHSPTGFSWSYNGSGPAQLALALLLKAGVDVDKAKERYQDFKMDVIAQLPDDFHIVLYIGRSDGMWVVTSPRQDWSKIPDLYS